MINDLKLFRHLMLPVVTWHKLQGFFCPAHWALTNGMNVANNVKSHCWPAGGALVFQALSRSSRWLLFCGVGLSDDHALPMKQFRKMWSFAPTVKSVRSLPADAEAASEQVTLRFYRLEPWVITHCNTDGAWLLKKNVKMQTDCKTLRTFSVCFDYFSLLFSRLRHIYTRELANEKTSERDVSHEKNLNVKLFLGCWCSCTVAPNPFFDFDWYSIYKRAFLDEYFINYKTL